MAGKKARRGSRVVTHYATGGVVGTITQTLPHVTQSAAGAGGGGGSVTGTITQTLPNVTQSGSGTASGGGSGAFRWGAYATNEPDPDLSAHYALETTVQHPLPVMGWYDTWPNGFLTSMAATARGGGYSLSYAWEAWGISFASILAGTQDSYITTWLTAAKNSGATIGLRLFHEMNGNWYDWSVGSPTTQVTSTANWKSAWQRIAGIRNTVGANNVKMVFCVNANDVGAHTMEEYYPGDAYVDVLALDGYAWGPGTTFTSDYSDMYSRLRTIAPSKTDYRVNELGADSTAMTAAQHTAWWTSVFDAVEGSSFPLITEVNFFHQTPFLLDTVPGSLTVIRNRLNAYP